MVEGALRDPTPDQNVGPPVRAWVLGVSTLTVVNVGILLANLAVFGLTLKLYTEYFKDRSQGARRG